MSDIDDLLKDIATDLAAMERIYIRDLASTVLSPDLIRNARRVIADQRSVLDMLAHAVAEKYGAPNDRAYFPITTDAAKFPKLLDVNITNLTLSKPKIAAAFERHQPYHPSNQALQYLPELSRVNKHQRITPQTRQEQRWVQSGGVGWTPDTVRFSGNVIVGGNPIDPITQRPPPGTYSETILVGWSFVDPPVPVLQTLKDIGRIVGEAAGHTS